jgi:hypothetical protein
LGRRAAINTGSGAARLPPERRFEFDLDSLWRCRSISRCCFNERHITPDGRLPRAFADRRKMPDVRVMASVAEARAVLATLLLLGACSPAPERTVATRSASNTAATEPRAEASFSTELARVEVRSQGVSLVLPDSPAWRATKTGTWALLRHDATRSELHLKLWRAARLVRAAECLSEARLGQPALLALRDEEVVERREANAPTGFNGQIVVAVREVGAELHGYAELSAAGIGRCYVAVFHTVVTGAQREQELGRRLAVMVENALVRTRTRSVEDRATP